MRKIREVTAFHIKINNLRLLAPCPVHPLPSSPSSQSASNCPAPSSCSRPSATSSPRATSSPYSSRHSGQPQLLGRGLVLAARSQRQGTAGLAADPKRQQLLGSAGGGGPALQGAGEARPSGAVVGLPAAVRLPHRPARAHPYLAARLRGGVGRAAERRTHVLTLPDRIWLFI